MDGSLSPKTTMKPRRNRDAPFGKLGFPEANVQ
jgi:hypothetical protein